MPLTFLPCSSTKNVMQYLRSLLSKRKGDLTLFTDSIFGPPESSWKGSIKSCLSELAEGLTTNLMIMKISVV